MAVVGWKTVIQHVSNMCWWRVWVQLQIVHCILHLINCILIYVRTVYSVNGKASSSKLELLFCLWLIVVEVVDDDENEIVDGEDDDYDGDNGVGVGEDERGGVGVRWGVVVLGL